MDSNIKNQRNSTIDTAKGFLMLCVVAGHIAGWPHNSVYFFYYFHLQTFFFISGYLFNFEKYKENPFSLIKSRARLYAKYIFYVFAFVACHNVLTIHGLNGITGKLYTPYDYVSSAIHSIFVPSEPLAGAMWFIPVLLIMQGIVYMVMKFRNYINFSVALDVVVVVSLFLTGFYFLSIKVYTTLDYRYLTFLPFFYAGVMARNIKINGIKPVYILIVSLLVMAYARHAGVNLNNYYSINPFELLSVSFFGVLFCLSTSSLIARTSLSKPFGWIGERTIHILALHFLGFKVATIVLAWYGEVGIDKIYDLGGGVEGRPGLTLIYLLSGIALPVLVVMAYDRMKKIMAGKRNGVAG